MASAGPQLPPSTSEKRKRDESTADQRDESSLNSALQRSRSPDSASKRQRTIGPTLPPASLDERPAGSPSDTGSEPSDGDDDDFGPLLPSAGTLAAQQALDKTNAERAGPQAAPQATRDEWMTIAPSSGDWSTRVDPTKLKNRKFNTGNGAKGPSQGGARDDDASWHETPVEKQARLQREILGIKDTRGAPELRQEDHKAAVLSKKLKEYTEKSRGSTLYNEHQKTNPQQKEDDPSARAFDREKDIAGGMKISTTQRKELMQKAGDFGTRFASAKYL